MARGNCLPALARHGRPDWGRPSGRLPAGLGLWRSKARLEPQVQEIEVVLHAHPGVPPPRRPDRLRQGRAGEGRGGPAGARPGAQDGLSRGADVSGRQVARGSGSVCRRSRRHPAGCGRGGGRGPGGWRGPAGVDHARRPQNPRARSTGAIRRAARDRCEIAFFASADHRPSVSPPGGSDQGSKIGS